MILWRKKDCGRVSGVDFGSSMLKKRLLQITRSFSPMLHFDEFYHFKSRLLEMVQAFGDIFKNTFPQHLWHFWKPSKYFIFPAVCLNFESCLCQQMLKQFYLFQAFFIVTLTQNCNIHQMLNFWGHRTPQTAFFCRKTPILWKKISEISAIFHEF